MLRVQAEIYNKLRRSQICLQARIRRGGTLHFNHIAWRNRIASLRPLFFSDYKFESS